MKHSVQAGSIGYQKLLSSYWYLTYEEIERAFPGGLRLLRKIKKQKNIKFNEDKQ